MKLTPVQAEEALDAISKFKVKSNASVAGYALAKNTIALSRVVKDHHKMRKETREKIAPAGQEIKHDSEDAKHLAQLWTTAATTEVEVPIHVLKLTELMRHVAVDDFTLLATIDFMLVDDLPLDGTPLAE